MKVILSIILICLSSCDPAYAGLPPTSSQGLSDASSKTTFSTQYMNQTVIHNGTKAYIETTAPNNFVANPSGTVNTTGWTLTNGSGTGAFVRDTTAGVGIDGTSYSLKFTAAGSGDYVTSSAMTLNNDVTGNCQVSGVYTTTSGVYSLNIMNGATVLQTLALPANTAYQPMNMNYPCASGYSLRVTASGTASGAGINFGKMYWGAATNLQNVSQASMYGSVDILQTASCYWNGSTSTTPANFTATAACPTPVMSGSATSAGKIPGLTFSSLPPGEYLVIAIGEFGKSAIANGTARYGLSDGTNLYSKAGVYSTAASASDIEVPSLTFRVPYTTAQSNITLQIQGWGDGTVAPQVDASAADFQMTVYRFPTSSQLAVTPQTSGQIWSGTATLSGTTASATFADLGSVSGTVTQVSSTNLSCVAATSLVGITCTPTTAGVFEISTSGYITNTGNNQTYNQVTDGSGNVLGGLQNNTITAAGNAASLSSTVQYVAASTSPFTIKWQGKNNGGTNTHYLTSASVRLVSQSIPAPVILPRTTYAQVTVSNSAAAVVAQGPSSWLSVANGAGAGLTTGTITGFSTVPACQCTIIGAASTSASWCGFTAEPSSSTLLITRTRAGAAENGDVNISCLWSQ